MGINITDLNTGKRIKPSYSRWADVLSLAIKYEWEPQGTKLPNGLYGEQQIKNWSGDYCSSDFQLITEDDVHNLADALRRTGDSDLVKVIEVLDGGPVRLS